jgi:hypothetical protein
MADEPMFPALGDKSQDSASASQSSESPASAPAPSGQVEIAPAAPAGNAPLLQDTPSADTQIPDLFGEEGAAAEASGGTGMVEAVVSTEDAKDQKLLGPKPKTSSGLDIRAKQFNLGGLLLKIAFVLALLVYGFFFTQFNETIGLLSKNPSQQLVALESSFETEQTDINLYNMLMAKFALDDFTVSADAFLLKWSQYQSDYTASNMRDDLVGELSDLQSQLSDSLEVVKEHVSAPMYPRFLVTSGRYDIPTLEQSYSLLLKEKILDEKMALDATGSDLDTSQEKGNLDSAGALASAKDFRRDLTALNLETDLTPEKIESLFTQATEVSRNQFGIVLNIKGERVDWADIIVELERVTKEIDPLYGTTIEGNLDYSNLTLNASDRTISVRGESRTDDSKNFTLLSELIDGLERSALFADVFNRTYTKADGTEGEDVTSSFNLNFSLQDGEDSRDLLINTVAMQELPPLPFLHGSSEEGDAMEGDAMEESLPVNDADPTDVDFPVFPTLEGGEEAPEDIQVMELTPEQEAEFEAALNEMTDEELDAMFDEAAEDVAEGLGDAMEDVVEGDVMEEEPVEEADLEEAEALATSILDVLTNLFTSNAKDEIKESNPRIPRTPRNQ